MQLYFSMLTSDEERDKFERLYHQYYKLMHKIAFDILHDGSLADDAVQNTCISIIKHFHQIEEVDSPRTRGFCSTIARNCALTEYRRMKRVLFAEDDPNLSSIPCNSLSPAAMLERKELRREVEAAIKKLKPADQEIIILKYQCHFTVTTIAKVTFLNVEVVKKRLQRARGKLLVYLKEKGFEHA